ncbi:hypothetical protein R4B61_04510 [Fructilactobacillus vespulae]|uniref:hypothetical protein n=1 Tax=Fructilactobacillus vespulae TaxID=1249630 RepID=UPI0039B5BF43
MLNVRIILEIIIGTIVATFIYSFLHYLFVTIPERNHQLQVKSTVDDQISMLMKKVKQNGEVKGLYFNSSKVLTNVWGRGVMVFEYEFRVETTLKINQLRSLTELELLNLKIPQAESDDIETNLIITDFWLNKNQLVFDVANRTNSATQEYVKDIIKMDRK